MAVKVYSFRLDEDLVARIDAEDRSRSVFVRDALEAALSGSPSVGTVPRKKNSNVPSGRGADAEVLRAALLKKRMTPREAEKAMGWLGLRYSNAEKRLIEDGTVHMVGGYLEVTDAE